MSRPTKAEIDALLAPYAKKKARGRKKLGSQPSRILKARLSGDDVETFLLRCTEIGQTPSAIIRKLIHRWMLEQRKLEKLRADTADRSATRTQMPGTRQPATAPPPSRRTARTVPE
jgi:hypothetical protein